MKLGKRRDTVLEKAGKSLINFRLFHDDSIGITLDETVSDDDLQTLLNLFVDDEPLSVRNFPRM